jgi:hypothetical protein
LAVLEHADMAVDPTAGLRSMLWLNT